MLFSRVFAATQPRTVLTSLPNACTPPRGSNSRRNIFRINTCKSLSKQTTLTVIESHSYRKQGGMEGVMVNQLQARRLRQLSLLAFFTLCTRFAANFALCFQKLPH